MSPLFLVNDELAVRLIKLQFFIVDADEAECDPKPLSIIILVVTWEIIHFLRFQDYVLLKVEHNLYLHGRVDDYNREHDEAEECSTVWFKLPASALE